jgi:hypothetical protein
MIQESRIRSGIISFYLNDQLYKKMEYNSIRGRNKLIDEFINDTKNILRGRIIYYEINPEVNEKYKPKHGIGWVRPHTTASRTRPKRWKIKHA